jgi:hypothetical protein
MAPSAERAEAPAMHRDRLRLLWINLLGGVAVLGSYVHGLATHPATRGDVWGGVPEALQPLYTANMFLAAAGYLTFTAFVFWRLDPDAAPETSRVPFRTWSRLYLLILAPSALWMPLTFAYLDSPSPALWWAVCGVLWTVGLASLAMIAALLRVRCAEAPRMRSFAIVGAVAFSLQTAVLDAIVWVAYFPA